MDRFCRTTNDRNPLQVESNFRQTLKSKLRIPYLQRKLFRRKKLYWSSWCVLMYWVIQIHYLETCFQVSSWFLFAMKFSLSLFNYSRLLFQWCYRLHTSLRAVSLLLKNPWGRTQNKWASVTASVTCAPRVFACHAGTLTTACILCVLPRGFLSKRETARSLFTHYLADSFVLFHEMMSIFAVF